MKTQKKIEILQIQEKSRIISQFLKFKGNELEFLGLSGILK